MTVRMLTTPHIAMLIDMLNRELAVESTDMRVTLTSINEFRSNYSHSTESTGFLTPYSAPQGNRHERRREAARRRRGK